jgi:urease accessory protein
MAITTTMTTTGTDSRSLLRLLTWLSPAFPVGGFAYSGGLERAVHDGLLTNAVELESWLSTMLSAGALWNDAVLLTEAWNAAGDPSRLAEVMELAEALAGSSERHLEIMVQGEAFVAAAMAWPNPVLDCLGRRPPYSTAVGAVAAAHDVTLQDTLIAFLHALASQGVSAAIRLGLLGQKHGLVVLAGLEEAIVAIATAAAASSLDDLGTATVIADIAAIRHETQYSRLFRS